MIGLYYRLKTRKNTLFKVIILSSILVICSLTAILLPQIVSPTNLSKHLSHMTNQSIGIHDTSHLIIDNKVYNSAQSLMHVNNFSWCVEQASLKAFGIYSPYSIGYIGYISIQVMINVDESYYTYLIGVADNEYELMRNYCSNSSSSNGAIIITQNASDPLGFYFIKIKGTLTDLSVTNLCTLDTLTSIFPAFRDFYNSTHLGELDKRFFIMSVTEIESLYREYILSGPYGSYYSLFGYLNFTQEQRDIMYWSSNSYDLVKDFREELNNSLISIDPTIELSFDHNNYDLRRAENNRFVVSLAFSIIHFIQAIVWILSFSLIFISITSLQREMENKEVAELFSGQKWGTRLKTHLLENSLIVFSSLIIAFIGLSLFLPLQLLFGFDFNLTVDILIPLTIFVIGYFVTVFIAYIDFELYLRRKLLSSINQTQKYKPLIAWPLYVKMILPFTLGLFFWLISVTLTAFFFLISFVLLALVLTLILVFLINLFSLIATKISFHSKRRKDKPFSKIFFLWSLWKKIVLRKSSMTIFLLSLILGGTLFCSFSADILRTQAVWFIGSDINTFIVYDYSSEFEQSIINNTNIINYSKSIYSPSYFNSTGFSQIYFAKEQINIGDEYITTIGLNKESYFSIFSDWRTTNWLSEGSINSFDNSTIFISKRLQDHTGANIGDSIILSTNTSQETLKIEGIINTWPTITDFWGDWTNSMCFLIADYNILEKFISNVDFYVGARYYIDVKEDKVIETVNYLKQIQLNLDLYESIEYLDPIIYKGIWQIFILPVIEAFQLFILMFFAFFILNSLSDRLSSPIAKSLGLLAQNQDYKRPFITLKVLELVVILVIGLLLYPLIYLLTLGYYSIESTLVNAKIFSFVATSHETILYSTIMFLLFIVLISMQFSYELALYRKLNLSLMYRHPE